MTASKKYLVDSSGWVEAVGAGPKAGSFQDYLSAYQPLIVPTIVIYEVYKKLLQTAGKTVAEQFASQSLRQTVVPLDEYIALAAAENSVRNRLAMADAIIYATALSQGAELVTGDSHFAGLPGVTIV